MCIIIYKPEGVELFERTLLNSFINNPHGAGFAYTEQGKIVINKGHFTFKDFMKEFEPHAKKQAIIHFRIRTHGNYLAENCHPFEVTPNLVFAHNGTIYDVPSDKEKSDTVQFNELILQNMIKVYGKRLIFDKRFKTLLKGYASGSRFVFMDAKGQVSIVNEVAGEWDSQCWFSNSSWEKINVVEKKSQKPKWTPKGNKVIPFPADRTPDSSLSEGTPQLCLPRVPPEAVVHLPEPTTIRPEPWKPLVIGNYVKTNTPYNNVNTGSLGKCMGFYQNGEVEVYFPIQKRFLRIPSIYLDRQTPIELNPEIPV